MKRNYLAQWNRVQRWYSRVQKIEKGQCEGGPEELLDNLHAFFLNCFHVKDWVKKDLGAEVGQRAEYLFDQVHGDFYLMVCADLVNADKHLIADHNPRLDENTAINKQSVTIQLQSQYVVAGEKRTRSNKNPPVTFYKWHIEVNGTNHDAFEVAKRSIKKWEDFLRTENLL